MEISFRLRGNAEAQFNILYHKFSPRARGSLPHAEHAQNAAGGRAREIRTARVPMRVKFTRLSQESEVASSRQFAAAPATLCLTSFLRRAIIDPYPNKQNPSAQR